ncbi:phage Gp37/Gp68 family protein [Paraburkholderia xenovorans]
MSENSKIEWTDHTFNPWEGCQKVSPGCDHCYAEARNARFAGGTAINWGPGAPRRRTSASNWLQPLQWNLRAARAGRRDRVFCASLADVFDNEAPDEWRRDLASVITQTAHLDWLLLTKRIGNAERMLADMFDGDAPNHVSVGATITSQPEADRDIEKLLGIEVAMHFISVEPMLGPLDVSRWLDPTGIACMDVCHEILYVDTKKVDTFQDLDEVRPLCPHCGAVASWTGYDRGIDWVICGGESGRGARPMHPDWARSLRDQCTAAGVPFLFKQWGEWVPGSNWPDDATIPSGELCNFGDPSLGDGGAVWRVGKKAAGRMLDGRTHDEFPGGAR